jgi:hypothetical protein
MIPEGTALFPEMMSDIQMFYDDEPYAYWDHNVGLWVLYKEYDNYKSVCHPNDCLRAYCSKELPKGYEQEMLFK